MFKKGVSGNLKGRPKGTTTIPKIKDFFTEEDIKELVEQVKKKAREGNDNMLKMLIEQIFGKAPQSIELPGGSGEVIIKWRK